MSNASVLTPGSNGPTASSERISLFQRVADRVSYGMGTPLNIFIWILLVVG